MEKQLSFLGTQKTPKKAKESKKIVKKTKSTKTPYLLFIDGASRGNPGASGAGIYLEKNNQEIFSKSFYLNKKTNNQAEYLALALGVFFLKKELKKKTAEITITSDSQLLVRQMRGFYKVKDPILKQIKNATVSLLEETKPHFKHVLRSYNKKADALANVAIDKKSNNIPKSFISLLKKFDLKI
jgi:ribonuclease HI